jgi:hypothetical protein
VRNIVNNGKINPLNDIMILLQDCSAYPQSANGRLGEGEGRYHLLLVWNYAHPLPCAIHYPSALSEKLQQKIKTTITA